MKTGMTGIHKPVAEKDEWLTPPEIMQSLGDFDLDPCSPVCRPWDTAKKHLSINDNGLLKEWSGRVWCNPPYGRETGKWLARCSEHKNATALIFARTETKDWVNFVWRKAHSILFIHGRLYFYHVDGSRAKSNSGAPSALISYNEENSRMLAKSKIEGSHVFIS